MPYQKTYYDPKLSDLEDDNFNKIWNGIKTWDINVPSEYDGYCSAMGNHVISIMISLGMRNAEDYRSEKD